MNQITERVASLRAIMKQRGIDIYVIPSADFHQSEYVGEYFKTRAFLTGFTGSAGTAVITDGEAGLWTDGRYFLQAQQQLKDTPYTLQKMGEEGVLTIEAYIEEKLQEKGVIGFDGRTISVEQGKLLAQIAKTKHGDIHFGRDLAGDIWEDRPQLSQEKAFFLEERFSGESVSHKLDRVRAAMKENGANTHVLTTLDDICWLFNMRGNDIAFSPLVLSYAIIYPQSAQLFVDKAKLDFAICGELQKNGVTICPYEEIYETVKRFECRDKILLDPEKLNYALYNLIPENVEKIEKMNPTTFFKAVKNPVEIQNIRNAHLKDGIAVTKFLYWLKTHVGQEEMSEMSVSEKLEEFRRAQDGFIGPSFAPISAYKEHAAIVHYESTPETNVSLRPEGLLLMDTGGHYQEGTTDITRTIALGPVSQEEREHFTIVAISMLALGNVTFLYGCDGANLDIIAREPFWKRGLNFNHGTGHGVGYLMNVHEGPNAFRWKNKSKAEIYPLEEGMITTDEPGLYIADSHGIRTENELLTVKAQKNANGQFMKFEYLTFVPVDLDAMDVNLMTRDDIQRLNDYHKMVYEVLSPFLTEEEERWLKKQTRSL
ncbi:MAG: aminopeptidase P family protein [Hespellia sp.]|nr:aminopeptidase P family protein [Hespellia sp.]